MVNGHVPQQADRPSREKNIWRKLEYNGTLNRDGWKQACTDFGEFDNSRRKWKRRQSRFRIVRVSNTVSLSTTIKRLTCSFKWKGPTAHDAHRAVTITNFVLYFVLYWVFQVPSVVRCITGLSLLNYEYYLSTFLFEGIEYGVAVGSGRLWSCIEIYIK